MQFKLIVESRVVAARFMAAIMAALILTFNVLLLSPAGAQQAQQPEYILSPGDQIKINVFKNPDLSVDARVSESGSIGMPLVGAVKVSGLTLPSAEKKIAELLKDGGFVLNAQVTLLVTQAMGSLVSVLGEVNRPGRYPLDAADYRLTGMLAAAGGIAPSGGEEVVVTGLRNGAPIHRTVNLMRIAQSNNPADDLNLAGGDTLFVSRAKVFYIYGQVQRPGQYRLDEGTTVMQALAAGGGMTGKGTTRGITIHRREAGKIKETAASLDDDVLDRDVIYVKESLF